MYRLLKFVGSNLTPAEAFFWCSLLPVLSYLGGGTWPPLCTLVYISKTLLCHS